VNTRSRCGRLGTAKRFGFDPLEDAGGEGIVAVRRSSGRDLDIERGPDTQDDGVDLILQAESPEEIYDTERHVLPFNPGEHTKARAAPMFSHCDERDHRSHDGEHGDRGFPSSGPCNRGDHVSPDGGVRWPLISLHPIRDACRTAVLVTLRQLASFGVGEQVNLIH
jgi:hypothetical protein